MSEPISMETLQSRIAALAAFEALGVVVPVLGQAETCRTDAEAARCLRFARQWMTERDEAGRLAALEQAERLEYDGVAGLLYAALAWTSGSMVDPRVSVVEVPSELSAKACAGAVLTAIAHESDEARKQLLIDSLVAALA